MFRIVFFDFNNSKTSGIERDRHDFKKSGKRPGSNGLELGRREKFEFRSGGEKEDSQPVDKVGQGHWVGNTYGVLRVIGLGNSGRQRCERILKVLKGQEYVEWMKESEGRLSEVSFHLEVKGSPASPHD